MKIPVLHHVTSESEFKCFSHEELLIKTLESRLLNLDLYSSGNECTKKLLTTAKRRFANIEKNKTCRRLYSEDKVTPVFGSILFNAQLIFKRIREKLFGKCCIATHMEFEQGIKTHNSKRDKCFRNDQNSAVFYM